MENNLVLKFEQVGKNDVNIVGGKNSSLGEMIKNLSAKVKVPSGFATTAYAFQVFLQENNLANIINHKLSTLNPENLDELNQISDDIQQLIIKQNFPSTFIETLKQYYDDIDQNIKRSYAVRSSATAEDLPDASFAGQQESYLNVTGFENILTKIKLVFASLYNARAISYRIHNNFEHDKVYISAGIQMMVRSDLASSGVMFTLDTESGFNDVVFITASYGLGETIVQGSVNPDEYYVYKPMLNTGKNCIIQKNIGSKQIKMIFNNEQDITFTGELVKTIDVEKDDSSRFVLTDTELKELAFYGIEIEKHYGCPMDIEWAKDGIDNQIYIVQARPETVQSRLSAKFKKSYRLKSHSQILVEGRAIGQKIGIGKVKTLQSIKEINKIEIGDVLVTDMTDPNWEPIMKKASAIVTNRGGRTCHAAIIARELGIPAIVGCGNATEKLVENEFITVNCSDGDTGQVYAGQLEVEILESKILPQNLPKLSTKVMINIGNPRLAFNLAQLPNDGVGLARLEFIINNTIGIHPQVILEYPNIDEDLKEAVDSICKGYKTPKNFYVEKLKEGIATIAAAFYPNPVIVRLSDFKSNEYKKLIGGSRYEPEEENPMLGFRGASRYVSDVFKAAFNLECEALKYAREQMGLTNIQIMVPFVRTLNQAKTIAELLAANGLKSGENQLKLIMMCEVPSNAILAEQFLEYFDGFSIGSNDLTQLTLGLDRDSGMELLAKDFDERDPAVKVLIEQAIIACNKQNKYIGICGQGPSDHEDFAKWLVEKNISSVSLNPDKVLDFYSYFSN